MRLIDTPRPPPVAAVRRRRRRGPGGGRGRPASSGSSCPAGTWRRRERALELVGAVPVARGRGRHPPARRGRDRRRGLGSGPSPWPPAPAVVAIGETGLDYDRRFSPIEDQLVNLRRNLALALATGQAGDPPLPERRRAARRAGRAARRAAGGRVRRRRPGAAFGDRPPAILHSVSGPVDYVAAALELGCAVSISGLCLPQGRGGDGRERAASCPPTGSWSRPTRRTSRRPGRRAGATSRTGSGITAAWVAEQRGERPRRARARSSSRPSTGSSRRRPVGRAAPADRRPSRPTGAPAGGRAA